MLDLVLKSRIPLIRATTRDRMNLVWVLEYFTDLPVKEMKITNPEAIPEETVVVVFPDKNKNFTWRKMYHAAQARSSVVVAMNVPPEDPMFDVGEVPVPKAMIRKWFKPMVLQGVVQKQDLPDLVSALGGCTIRQVSEYVRLTLARDHGLTRRGLVKTRKMFFSGARGLTNVDTQQQFYLPDPRLVEYVEREKTYFLHAPQPFLLPRGLLFDGPPGIGKTEGAKYIAAQWGVPLHRLDVGGAKEKWVGSSQEHMLTGLALVDQEEPCVLLLDEVEKVFSAQTHDSSGTTTEMLSQLLWWLAEHKTRVFTVMTTNAKNKIPKELYREGRIDQVMEFQGLSKSEAKQFVNALIASYGLEFVTAQEEEQFTLEVLQEAFSTPKESSSQFAKDLAASERAAHAALDTKVRKKIKDWSLLTQSGNQSE